MKLESVDKLCNEKKRGGAVLWLVFLCFLAVLAVVAVKLYEMEVPQVTLLTDVARFGAGKRVVVEVSDSKSGIRQLEVVMEQAGRRVPLYEKKYAGEGVVFVAGPNQREESFDVDTVSLGLAEGDARLLVTVRDFSWWHWRSGNVAESSFPVVIDTTPPRVRITASPVYIKSGGAGIVVYRLSEDVARHGASINGDFHPGYPLPSHGEHVYGATIAVRYDAEKINEAFVSATDQAGNVGRENFAMILPPLKKKFDKINISDGFLSSKVPEFADHNEKLSGTLLEQYLVINSKVRLANNERIAEVCSSSAPERFWQGVFGQLGRSSNKAGYADYRTYYYDGREIDKQVHLGIDLASTRHATVGAANRGRVVFADYLGIYGNAVIIDHGMGIFSLYSHLSQIDVKSGDMVEKGDSIGRTGTTGMAGGDHLHFSMLVDGIFVNPLEWWDAHWLKINVESYL